MKPKMILASSMVLILSLLAACSSFAKKNTPTPLPTSTPLPTPIPTPTSLPTDTPSPTPTVTPFPNVFLKSVDFAEFSLGIQCFGQGEPTIILEHGLGGYSWSDFSLTNFKTISRTCTYTRRDVFNLHGWRTTEDQVKELHNLLTKAGIPGPYVLVGHSIAGYNLVLYTYHYPEEVAGLVCVDCRPSMFNKNLLEAMGEEQPDESEEIKQGRRELTQLPEGQSFDQAPEGLDIIKSAAQVQIVTSLGDIPFIVLVAEKTTQDELSISESLTFGQIWLTSSEEFSKLSSRGRMEIVPGKDHGTILYSDSVTKAIQEVVDAAREKP
jgi:pimeloyl-ACP methyl ester carboxylesterase